MAFAPPEPFSYDDIERKNIAHMACQLYRDGIHARTEWNANHDLYDQMMRSNLEPRTGPWSGAADLHVQLPYWMVSAVNVRMVSGIWNQIPLVGGEAHEDDDKEIFRDAATLVAWDFQPKRMQARAKWNRASKIRLIHGNSYTLFSYAHVKNKYRVVEEGIEGDGEEAQVVDQVVEKEETRYSGPVMTPLDYQDVVKPIDAQNIQPNDPSNPEGADWLITRQWEPLSLMAAKFGFSEDANGNESPNAYYLVEGEQADVEWWRDKAPAQDRSSSPNSYNAQSSRTHDRAEGVNRNHQRHKNRGSDNAETYSNPEFEIITYWGRYGEENEEMVICVCVEPQLTLGAFRLSDLYYSGKRPVMEMMYETVGVRGYAMGIMEIVQHLSAELDTIHNMRMDIGFATNMPFFFYSSTDTDFEPNDFDLHPLAAIPIDNPTQSVYFPQMPSVTTFYTQEEQLLYSLAERVVGVTDLTLGVSPTHGAAARHATGFVGTQQEALARTSEIQYQDAESFSFACHMTYELEMQYGPEERTIRLQGKSGPLTQRLNRGDLKMRGDYDFRLGANMGTFSQQVKQERAMALLQFSRESQFAMQDPGRVWEAESRYLHSIGIDDPQNIIGHKDAISVGTPRAQDEEVMQMAQYKWGVGVPAPVHPDDNDIEHIQQLMEIRGGADYEALGRPNEPALMKHAQLHEQQIAAKRQRAQQGMLAEQNGNNGAVPAEGTPTPGNQDRMLAGMMSQGQGNTPEMQNNPTTPAPNPSVPGLVQPPGMNGR